MNIFICIYIYYRYISVPFYLLLHAGISTGAAAASRLLTSMPSWTRRAARQANTAGSPSRQVTLADSTTYGTSIGKDGY